MQDISELKNSYEVSFDRLAQDYAFAESGYQSFYSLPIEEKMSLKDIYIHSFCWTLNTWEKVHNEMLDIVSKNIKEGESDPGWIWPKIFSVCKYCKVKIYYKGDKYFTEIAYEKSEKGDIFVEDEIDIFVGKLIKELKDKSKL